MACSFQHHQEYSIPNARLKISPGVKREFNTIQVCKQCEEKFCLEACPVEAITLDSEGICNVDSETCIGCGMCVEACIYDGIWMNVNTEKAVKCNLCSSSPACVKVCIAKAIELVEEPRSMRN